uniref:PH domain-containing protein n=1 Tax=Glossina brevipalpis TaxID=37001 RepID=A0A1A9WWB5_9MUSC
MCLPRHAMKISRVFGKRRRERGRIPVKGVRLVETATVNGEGGDPFAPDGYPFQVGYCESNDDQSQRAVPQYTLYLVANTEKERSDWIYAIRQECNEQLRTKRTMFIKQKIESIVENDFGIETCFDMVGRSFEFI